MTGLNPTARALTALRVLQDHPGLTAADLGERLGVSERAARRYVTTLRDAGIPVEVTRGRFGGYRVGRGLRPPPLTFTSAEALALVLAALDGHHRAGDADDPVGSALGKILRVLPEAVAAQAEVVRRTASPTADPGAVRPDPLITAQIVTATAERTPIRLWYRQDEQTHWDRVVHPWGVVVRHGRWYLWCRRGDRDETRIYRIDRVTRTQRSSEAFVRPPPVDPVLAVEEHMSTGWNHPVEVVIEAPVDQARRCVPRSIGRLSAIDPEHSLLVGSTSAPDFYAEQLALTGLRFTVRRGDEVRRAVAELGHRLLRASGTGPVPPDQTSNT